MYKNDDNNMKQENFLKDPFGFKPVTMMMVIFRCVWDLCSIPTYLRRFSDVGNLNDIWNITGTIGGFAVFE